MKYLKILLVKGMQIRILNKIAVEIDYLFMKANNYCKVSVIIQLTLQNKKIF